RRARDVAGFADRGGDADGTGVGGAQLDLAVLSLRAEDGGLEGAFGADDGDLLLTGELAGLGEVLLVGQGRDLAEQDGKRLLGHVDVSRGSFYDKSIHVPDPPIWFIQHHYTAIPAQGQGVRRNSSANILDCAEKILHFD